MGNVSALVLIYDIRGFTAASKRLKTAALGAFAEGAHRAILDLFAARPPTFVKNLGDGHLLLWETDRVPDPALIGHVVAGATAARTAFAAFAAGQEAAGVTLPRHVGVGVAFGEVSRADDYYGVALNLASRLQGIARPEGLAMDCTVFEAATSRDEALKVGFRRSRVRLKGLGSTVVWVKRPFSWRRILSRVGRVAAVLLVPLLYVALSDAGLHLPGGDALRTWIDRVRMSVFRPTRGESEAREAAAAQRRELAAGLLAGLQPSGWMSANLSKPGGDPDVWSSSQAFYALLKAPEADREGLRRILPGMDEVFGKELIEKDGVPWGWRPRTGYEYTEVEPALWTAAALAAGIARPGFLTEEEKGTWRNRLRRTQAVLALFRPVESGGWNMFPRQKDETFHSPYAATLALLVLLETRAAGQPWEGSLERPDSLIRSTARWLIERFDGGATPAGWHRTVDTSDPVSPGLTLQTFGTLLRAEAETGLEVPASIHEALTSRLIALADSTMADTADSGEFGIVSMSLDGRMEMHSESINFLWHPWAIDAAARWLERSRRAPGEPEDVERVRRALGHLVVDLGPQAVKSALSGWTFVASETLCGLCSVPP